MESLTEMVQLVNDSTVYVRDQLANRAFTMDEWLY